MDDCNDLSKPQCGCDPKAQSLKSEMGHLAYIVDALIPESNDILINDKKDIPFFGRLLKLFLEIKELHLQPLTKSELVSLCNIISKVVFEIQSTHRNGVFDITLSKAMEVIGFSPEEHSKAFDNFCETHFLELDSHIQHNIIRPVAIIEKKLFEQVNIFIHKTRDFEVIKKLMKICPAFNVQMLTNENKESLIHFVSLLDVDAKDVLEVISLCLDGIPLENQEELVNLQRAIDGNTALHLASQNANKNIVKCLLKYHANTSLTNNIGQTALDIAANDNIVELIKKSKPCKPKLMKELKAAAVLKENKGELSSEVIDLTSAIKHSNICKVKEILEGDKSCVNKKNKIGVSPLITAVISGNAEIVQILLRNGADASEVYNGKNALHYAVKKRNELVVKALLDHIDDVNVRCQNTGNTALHLAAESGHLSIVKLLIDRGANFEAKNNLNQAPKDGSTDEDVYDILNSTACMRAVPKDPSSHDESIVNTLLSDAKNYITQALTKSTNDRK